MGKVLISIPDSLLARVDAYAKAHGETRSGFLQRLAEAEIEAAEGRRQQEARRLLAELRADFGAAEPTVDVAQLIRDDRDSR